MSRRTGSAARPLGYSAGSSTGERILPHQLARRAHYVTHVARYAFAAAAVPPGRALDSGCGTGYGTRLLADSGFDVLGVDVSPEAVAYARAVYETPRARFELVEASRLYRQRAEFDLVTSFEVIEHIEQPEAYLGSIRRVLRPSGTLVISTPNRDRSAWSGDRPANPFHVTEFRAVEFRHLLEEAGFPAQAWFGQRLGRRTRRLARAVAAVGVRCARLRRIEEMGYWPAWWERVLTTSLAPLLARTTWRAVARENEVVPLPPEQADYFVVIASGLALPAAANEGTP